MADNDRGPSALHVVSGGKGAELAAAKRARVERLTTLHTGNMNAIETKYGGRIADAQEELNAINGKWDSIQAEVDRQPRYARAIFYWPFMLALMLFEIPVNRLSFELFFRESPAVSLGVAFLVGVILVTLAHRLGVLFCRFGYYIRKSGWVSSLIQMVLITAMILALVYGVSVLRQGYLDFETQPRASFSDMLAGTGAAQMAGDMFKAGLGISGWIFFAINMGIIAVGLTASYFSHDPHPDFQAADIQRKRAERKLSRIKGHRADTEAVELRRHANQINRANA
ncbi:MAG: hypothetical protein ACK4MQ_05550 [Hyphomonas sp.]